MPELVMIGYQKDGTWHVMGLSMSESSWWAETLRKVQDYHIPQRRLTAEEFEKHFGKRHRNRQ